MLNMKEGSQRVSLLSVSVRGYGQNTTTVYLQKIRHDKNNYCRVLPKQLEIKLQNSYRTAKVPNN